MCCPFTTLSRPRFLLPDRFSYLLTFVFYSCRRGDLFEPRRGKSITQVSNIFSRKSLYFSGYFINKKTQRFGNHCWPGGCRLVGEPLPWLQVKRHLYRPLFRQQAQDCPADVDITCLYTPTQLVFFPCNILVSYR